MLERLKQEDSLVGLNFCSERTNGEIVVWHSVS